MIEALIFSLPFGTRKILGHVGIPWHEWNAIFLSLTDVLLIALFLFVLAKKRIRQAFEPVDAPILGLALFLAAVGISVAWHGFDPLSLFRYAKLLSFAAFALLVRRSVHDGKGQILLALFVFAVLLQSVIAISQFFTQEDLGLAILGESSLDRNAAGVAKIDVGPVKLIRAYGTLPHPNVLGAYLLTAVFAAWSLGLRSSPAWWVAVVFPFLLALVLTFSRAAFVSFLFGAAAAVCIAVVRTGRISRSWKIVSTAFLYAGMLSFLIYGALFLPFWKTRAIPSASEGAVIERIFYADAARKMFMRNPIFGVGLGRFSDRLAEYVEPEPVAVPSVSFPLWMMQPAHNIYLLIASEAGIGAAFFFLLFAATVLVRAIARGGVMRVPLAVGLAAILVMGFFDHFLFTIQQGALLFWFLIGILMADREQKNVRRRSFGNLPAALTGRLTRLSLPS